MSSTGLLAGFEAMAIPVIIAGIILLILLPLARRALKESLTSLGWRKPRQRRKEKVARNALERIRQLPSDQARFAYLRSIDPYVFEELILESFEQLGHRIKRNTRYSGDGGIDGRVWGKSGQLYLVQAKRYKGHINPQHVQEFASLVHRNKCRGVFIHTGRTGKLARDIALQNPNLKIISGPKLMRLILPPPQQ